MQKILLLSMRTMRDNEKAEAPKAGPLSYFQHAAQCPAQTARAVWQEGHDLWEEERSRSGTSGFPSADAMLPCTRVLAGAKKGDSPVPKYIGLVVAAIALGIESYEYRKRTQ